MAREPVLVVQTPPFLRQGITTPRLMADVVIALAPVVLAATYYFGISAILVLLATTLGAVLCEWVLTPLRPRGASLRDNTAILTGVLLALTLPPGFPLWMAFLGGVVGVGLGKLVFGGLGQNPFNPALVGRAFLQAAFPTAITTWVKHGGPADILRLYPSSFAVPLMSPPEVPPVELDAISTSTPLALWKFENTPTEVLHLLLGATGGSLGETCALLIILAGLYLGLRRSFDWRIPVSILVTVALFSGILFAVDPQRFPSPLFMLLSGGLLFGAVYMATDPVTSPLAPLGAWIFGIGIGLLVVLIRIWGGLPEAVMYAILLMNAATPLIERFVHVRPLGRTLRGEVAA